MSSIELTWEQIKNISIHPGWFNKRPDVVSFNEQVRRMDKLVYCGYDYKSGFYKVYKKLPYKMWGKTGEFYKSGFYKVYKKLPYKMWGKTGEFDGEDYPIFIIKTPKGNPRLPGTQDLRTLKSMEMTRASYAVRKQSDTWKKFLV
jgi:hypothetical protein